MFIGEILLIDKEAKYHMNCGREIREAVSPS